MPNRSTMAQTRKSTVVISPANKKENNGRTPSTSKVQGIRPVLATQKRRGKLQQQETAPPTAVKRPAAPPRRRLHQRTTLSPNHRQSVRDDGAGAETQNEDKSLSRPNPPNEPLTIDDCLALLQLRRPLEPKTELGLAEGIGTHLTENIKLSGLRKARETALLDMVKTLTRHLENREETIVTWVAFADKVALLSARQIHKAQQETHDLAEAARRSYFAILAMQTQVQRANCEVKDALCEIKSILSRFQDEVVKELISKFTERAVTESEAIQAESKCQRADELEELAMQHGNQVKHLRETISNLEASLSSTTDETKIAKDDLKLANEEIVKLNTMIESSHVKYSELQHLLDQSDDKVKTLQQRIEDIDKKREQELAEKDKMMESELNTVHEKVTKMVRAKNTEVERANKRATEAEARANAAELLLKQLQEGFVRA